jgi:HEXXH motif-containing protein
VLPAAGVISLPSLGAARVDADSAVISSRAGHAEIRWARGRIEISPDAYRDEYGWQGIRNCHAERLETVIEDLDPFRMPAVTGLAPRLTAAEARHWAGTLRQGWQVLATGHPAVAAKVAAAVSVIVPLSRSPHGQLSSSSPESFGAVAMSEPPDPDTCASTLVHETQHLKLCALLDVVSMTLPDDGLRYYAPWRTDPRPLAGLLQGAYAYLGVTEFWRKQRRLASGAAQLRADDEFALWRAGTVRVIDTLLSSNRLTAAGTDFVQRMSEATSGWGDELVSAQARVSALRESRRHLTQWAVTNGPVPA